MGVFFRDMFLKRTTFSMLVMQKTTYENKPRGGEFHERK